MRSPTTPRAWPRPRRPARRAPPAARPRARRRTPPRGWRAAGRRRGAALPGGARLGVDGGPRRGRHVPDAHQLAVRRPDPLWVATPMSCGRLLPLDDEQLAADLAVISAPLDFYGVNYYEPVRIEAPRADVDYAGTLEVDIPEGMPFAPVPTRPRSAPISAGRSRPRRSRRSSSSCTTAIRACPRSSSPRTVLRSTTCRTPTVRCTTRAASPSWMPTCGPSWTRSTPGSTCAGTTCGRPSTTSNGRRGTASASDSSTSTSRPQERIRKDSWAWYRDVIAANS